MKKVLYVILLLVVLGAGAFYANTEIEAKKVVIDDLTAKNTALTAEIATLKEQAAAAELATNQAKAQLDEVARANCKGTYTTELGCQEPVPVFTYPVGGENLCFGTTIPVKWDQNSVNSESVEVFLATSSNSGKLASMPNTGSYDWKLETTHKAVGGGGNFTIAAGMYRLRLQTEEGKPLGKDTELFTIKKCGADKSAAAPAKPVGKAPTKMPAKAKAKPKRK